MKALELLVRWPALTILGCTALSWFCISVVSAMKKIDEATEMIEFDRFKAAFEEES